MATAPGVILIASALLWFKGSLCDTNNTISQPNPICEEESWLLDIHKDRYADFRDLQYAILANLDTIEAKTELSLSVNDEANCTNSDTPGIIVHLQSLRGQVQRLGQNVETISTTPSSCADVQATRLRFGAEPVSGVYALHVNRIVIRAYCDLKTDGGGWTVFQRRTDADTDFNRKWDEYKRGFGHPGINYWLGNDYIHLMTSGNGGQELRVELTDWNDTLHHITYADFSVTDERSDYKLVLGEGQTLGGDLPDALNGMHHGRVFSTKDRHMNYYPCVNCPRYCQGAWWYGCCYTANLNGRLMRPEVSDKEMEAARWYNMHTRDYVYAKNTEMKFRPSGFGKRG